MEPTPREITWEAPQHHHVEKGNDWFFALLIIVAALVTVAILFKDYMFALLIGVAGGVLAMAAAKRPAIVPYGVSVRGVKVEGRLYPYANLLSYHIDEEDPRGPKLFLRTEKKMLPLLVLPLPEDHIDDIDHILKDRLPEEKLEEPFMLMVLELFGF
jgi:hypothetical protein